MDIKDMEILIECKRLVEHLLRGEKYILEKLEQVGKDTKVTQCKIEMMERALEGKPFEAPAGLGRMFKDNLEGV